MTITVEAPGRIDKILADTHPQYSRAALAKLFDMDLITLNGKVVRPGHKVRVGAIIEADLSPLQQEQQVVELPIIYEDDNVIVIDKPAGIISHARGRYWYEPSVASFVRWKLSGGEMLVGEVVPNSLHTPETMVTKSYPLTSSADTQQKHASTNHYLPSSDRSGIVHRLDRATSGIMICAKNSETMSFLQKQFAARKVEKTYIALVEGMVEPPKATIDAPIERNPKNPSQFRVGPNGKSAITEYSVIRNVERGISKGNEKKAISNTATCSLIEFKPKTGRTHQLRVHALYIGHPIVGDTLYGNGSDRLYLHAHKLTIALPGNTKPTTFISPIPWEGESK